MSPKAAPTLESYSYDLAEAARETLDWHNQAPGIQPQRCVFVGDVLSIPEENRVDSIPSPDAILKRWLNRLSLQVYATVAASQAGYDVATGKSESVVLHATLVTCGYDHANKTAKKSFIQPYMEPFRLEVRRWKPVEHIDSDVQHVVEVVVSRVEFTQD